MSFELELATTVSEWIEIAGVVVIAAGVLIAIALSLRSVYRETDRSPLSTFKVQMGRFLLIGLELLIAADIIRTVTIDPSLEAYAELGLLVLIRTFLSWTILVEIEGRWPWQPKCEVPSEI